MAKIEKWMIRLACCFVIRGEIADIVEYRKEIIVKLLQINRVEKVREMD